MKEKAKHCALCGRAYSDGEAAHGSVVRVVRPGQIFAGKKAGEHVDVCELDVGHRSTQLGSMPLEEWEAKRAAARRPVAQASGPTSVDIARNLMATVRAGFDALRSAHSDGKPSEA